jgi:hypothetical protein
MPLLNFAKSKSRSSWEYLSSTSYDQKMWNHASLIGCCKTYFQCAWIHFKLSCSHLFSIFNEEIIDIEFNNSSNSVCNPYWNITDFKQSKKLIYSRSVSNLDWKHDQILHQISCFRIERLFRSIKKEFWCAQTHMFCKFSLASSIWVALDELILTSAFFSA